MDDPPPATGQTDDAGAGQPTDEQHAWASDFLGVDTKSYGANGSQGAGSGADDTGGLSLPGGVREPPVPGPEEPAAPPPEPAPALAPSDPPPAPEPASPSPEQPPAPAQPAPDPAAPPQDPPADPTPPPEGDASPAKAPDSGMSTLEKVGLGVAAVGGLAVAAVVLAPELLPMAVGGAVVAAVVKSGAVEAVGSLLTGGSGDPTPDTPPADPDPARPESEPGGAPPPEPSPEGGAPPGPSAEGGGGGSGDGGGSAGNGDPAGDGGDPPSSGEPPMDTSSPYQPRKAGGVQWTEPQTLQEQVALQNAQSGGGTLAMDHSQIKDPKYADPGWVKNTDVVQTKDGNKVELHYMYNTSTHQIDQVKFIQVGEFKPPPKT